MTEAPHPKDSVQIQMIGYWRPPDCFPDPLDSVDSSWDLEERDVVIDHLRHGTPFRHMMGLSPCRICGDHYETHTEWWELAPPAPRDPGNAAAHHVYFVPEEGPMWNALIRGREWVRLIRR